jgi:hypothetical protein
VIDEVFADHYLDVVKAAALLRLPPTLTEGLARIPTEGPLARSSHERMSRRLRRWGVMGAPGGRLCVPGRFGQATSSRSRWTSAEIFSMVLCTVSSLCALRPERIHPRTRLDGGVRPGAG